MIELAIVIPAYKGMFLDKTLDALVNQTNKYFNVYIGNDNSPDDLDSIVARYKGAINIKYKRFPDNLGRNSLVSHWTRSIALTKNESWLWILPDDDVPNDNCVDEFVKRKTSYNHVDVFRFVTNLIDEDGSIIKSNPQPPTIERSESFIINKLQHLRSSTVAEYIFRRRSFDSIGFLELPLAWGSDDLLWYNIAKENGIYTINDAYVGLRQSRFNLSNAYKPVMNNLKLKAIYKYFSYLNADEYFDSTVYKDENVFGEFISASKFYLFDFYKGYRISINVFNIFWLAKANAKIWKDGYLRNIFRLIRFHLKTSNQ